MSTYHTNLQIDENKDISSSFRLTGQVKTADGSPAPYPPKRYHPTQPDNMYIYQEKLATEKEVPNGAYAQFWGEERVDGKVINPDHQIMGNSVAAFYGKKADLDYGDSQQLTNPSKTVSLTYKEAMQRAQEED